MLPCQELKIFDHTPPLNQYTRQTVRKMKNYPQVVYCEAFTKRSGKNNILSCRERGDDPLDDLPQAGRELNFAHQTFGHGMFGGLSLLALPRRQLVVSPHATTGSVYCSTQCSSDKSVSGSTTIACALPKRTVAQGKGELQCTCPFSAEHKPTNQTRGVNIPKHQSVSASCQPTIKHMWLFTGLAWDHLLGPVDVCVGNVPCRVCSNLFKQVLMLIHPLPCQSIKPLEIKGTDPLTREPRNGLLRKPSLTIPPLLLDPSPVLSLIGVLQPPGFFRVIIQKEASKKRIVRETCGLFGPDSISDFGPDRFNVVPNMTRL